MLDNDTIGDCTIAAVGHAIQTWTSVVGSARVMTDAEALQGYERFGYVPGNPDTDNGANAQDVLQSWSSPGFQCGGVNDSLDGFCTLRAGDPQETKEGVAWLGAVYAGILLPLGVQGASEWDCGPLDTNGAPSTGPWAPGSWGGHAVPIVGYASRGLIVVTWGSLLWMSWPFWKVYGDEAYGLLSRDFASASIPSEAWDSLESDMAALRAQS